MTVKELAEYLVAEAVVRPDATVTVVAESLDDEHGDRWLTTDATAVFSVAGELCIALDGYWVPVDDDEMPPESEWKRMRSDR